MGRGRGRGDKVATVEAIPLYPELEPMPSPIKGIEGIQAAHETLQAHGLVGYLIGGVAEEMQLGKSSITVESLSFHKDVDVLIPEDVKWPEKIWQYRIDWWKIRRDGYIRRAGESIPYLTIPGNPRFDFSVESAHEWAELEPGLYIPDADETRAKVLLETASKLARLSEPIELLDNTFLEFEKNKPPLYNIMFSWSDDQDDWGDWLEQRSLVHRENYDYSTEPIFKIIPPPEIESVEHNFKTGSILRKSSIERIRKLGNQLIDQTL
jgi:hypothetical protein